MKITTPAIVAAIALAIGQTLTTPAYAANTNFVPYAKFTTGGTVTVDVNNIEKYGDRVSAWIATPTGTVFNASINCRTSEVLLLRRIDHQGGKEQIKLFPEGERPKTVYPNSVLSALIDLVCSSQNPIPTLPIPIKLVKVPNEQDSQPKPQQQQPYMNTERALEMGRGIVAPSR